MANVARFGRAAADEGTTITEVLVVLAIMGILAVPLASVLNSASRNEQSGAVALDLQTVGARVEDRLRRDLREGTIDWSDQGTRPSEQMLVLTTSRTDGPPVEVQWSVVRQQLRRRELDIPTGRVLLDSVLAEVTADPASPFAYFQPDGDRASLDRAAGDPCVARVEVSLVLQEDTTQHEVSVRVSLRQLEGQKSC